jgi:hypothetical protein
MLEEAEQSGGGNTFRLAAVTEEQAGRAGSGSSTDTSPAATPDAAISGGEATASSAGAPAAPAAVAAAPSSAGSDGGSAGSSASATFRELDPEELRKSEEEKNKAVKLSAKNEARNLDLEEKIARLNDLIINNNAPPSPVQARRGGGSILLKHRQRWSSDPHLRLDASAPMSQGELSFSELKEAMALGASSGLASPPKLGFSLGSMHDHDGSGGGSNVAALLDASVGGKGPMTSRIGVSERLVGELKTMTADVRMLSQAIEDCRTLDAHYGLSDGGEWAGITNLPKEHTNAAANCRQVIQERS